MKVYPNLFYAKIMLFGEYSVIFNSMAITIPYSHFNGELSFIRKDSYTNQEFAKKSNDDLNSFYNYIHNLVLHKTILCDFNDVKLKKDIDKGLYFESTIPQGYGLGSSGALCASLYNGYVKNKITGRSNLSLNQILDLKSVFSQLESFFHGTSSGLDPLNAYLKYSLLIRNKDNVEIVKLPVPNLNGMGAIFLIDTEIRGNTQPLVNLFLDTYKIDKFKNAVNNELIVYNNACVNSILEGDINKLFENLRLLSKFQLEQMNQMIPYTFHKLWEKGISENNFTLKLCGSGGGGFILGFTKNYDVVKKQLSEIGIRTTPVFIS